MAVKCIKFYNILNTIRVALTTHNILRRSNWSFHGKLGFSIFLVIFRNEKVFIQKSEVFSVKSAVEQE